MTVFVKIPTPLRKFTDNKDTVEVDGDTVGQVLQGLAEAHPDLRKRLFSDDGKVRRFVNIFANEEDVRFLESMDTTLSDGDEVSIVPAIAGGSR